MKKLLSLVFLFSSAFISADDHQSIDAAYNYKIYFSSQFLKPGSSLLHYAAEALPLPLPSPSWCIFDVHPGYHFGFDLGMQASTIDDHLCMINWQHFDSSHKEAVSVAAQNMVGPFFEIGPDASAYSNAIGAVQFNFNEINIDVGHAWQSAEKLQTNVFAGVSIVGIRQIMSQTFSSTNGNTVRIIETPTQFFGAGIQAGGGFSYELSQCFSLMGKALCSMLSGSVKNHTLYYGLSPLLNTAGVNPPNKQSTTTQKRTQLIPVFQEKLGLSYVVLSCDKADVNLAFGYQAQIYMSALQSLDIGSEVITPPVTPDTIGVYARTFQRNISNFALSGFFLTAEVVF